MFGGEYIWLHLVGSPIEWMDWGLEPQYGIPSKIQESERGMTTGSNRIDITKCKKGHAGWVCTVQGLQAAHGVTGCGGKAWSIETRNLQCSWPLSSS